MLETEDLVLRSGSPDDGVTLYRNLWSRVEVFRYLFSRPCGNEDAGMRKTAAYAEMHRAVPTEFFIYEKTSGMAIGIAGIKRLSQTDWTVTDIALGPDYQGKGYGRQVLSALMTLAFEAQGATALWYDCFAENEVSRQLALKCGFLFHHSEEAELQKDGRTVMLEYFRSEKACSAHKRTSKNLPT